MRDVETGTEWAHLLGKGMAGKYKGRKLKPLITDMVTWGTWKKQHPDTTVLFMSRTSKDYGRQFYSRPQFFVYGFEVNGETRSIQMASLLANPVANFELAGVPLLVTFDEPGTVTHLFERTINDKTLTFEQSGADEIVDKETGTRWKIVSGEAIEGPLKGSVLRQRVGIMSYRRAWENFHPASRQLELP